MSYTLHYFGRSLNKETATTLREREARRGEVVKCARVKYIKIEWALFLSPSD